MSNENKKRINEASTPHHTQRPTSNNRQNSATPSKGIRPNSGKPQSKGK